MILSHRHLNGRDGTGLHTAGRQPVSARLIPVRIEEHLFRHPAQRHHRLAGSSMPMRLYHSPRFDRIQHPLAPIFSAIAQIVVHAEARGRFRLGGENIEESIIYYHSLFGSLR